MWCVREGRNRNKDYGGIGTAALMLGPVKRQMNLLYRSGIDLGG